MSFQTVQSACDPAKKSPLLAAIGISLVIGLGALLGTAEPATVEDAVSGKWFTRPFTETQQSHTVAIAALAHSLGSVSREIDFVAARVNGSIQRNENETFDRFAKLDAEITALKDTIAGVQNTRVTTPHPSPAPNAPGANADDVTGLRSSLHDLATAQRGAVAALTRRLDRVEVMVGLSTDMTSSVANPLAQRARRAAAAKPRNAAPAVQKQAAARLPAGVHRERGHIFSLKPLNEQAAPLRGSKPAALTLTSS